MKIPEIMKEIKSNYNEFVNDSVCIEYYGDIETIQKMFISYVQKALGSNFVVMSKEELQKRCMDFHDSMEGTLQDE